jgi:hypothetical protein
MVDSTRKLTISNNDSNIIVIPPSKNNAQSPDRKTSSSNLSKVENSPDKYINKESIIQPAPPRQSSEWVNIGAYNPQNYIQYKANQLIDNRIYYGMRNLNIQPTINTSPIPNQVPARSQTFSNYGQLAPPPINQESFSNNQSSASYTDYINSQANKVLSNLPGGVASGVPSSNYSTPSVNSDQNYTPAPNQNLEMSQDFINERANALVNTLMEKSGINNSNSSISTKPAHFQDTQTYVPFKQNVDNAGTLVTDLVNPFEDQPVQNTINEALTIKDKALPFNINSINLVLSGQAEGQKQGQSAQLASSISTIQDNILRDIILKPEDPQSKFMKDKIGTDSESEEDEGVLEAYEKNKNALESLTNSTTRERFIATQQAISKQYGQDLLTPVIQRLLLKNPDETINKRDAEGNLIKAESKNGNTSNTYEQITFKEIVANNQIDKYINDNKVQQKLLKQIEYDVDNVNNDSLARILNVNNWQKAENTTEASEETKSKEKPSRLTENLRKSLEPHIKHVFQVDDQGNLKFDDNGNPIAKENFDGKNEMTNYKRLSMENLEANETELEMLSRFTKLIYGKKSLSATEQKNIKYTVKNWQPRKHLNMFNTQARPDQIKLKVLDAFKREASLKETKN